MGDPAAPNGPSVLQGWGLAELRRDLALASPDDVIFIDIGHLPGLIMSYAIFVRDIVQLRDPSPPEREELLRVKNDGLRVRSSPEIRDNNIVASLSAGTTLTVKGKVLAGGYTWAQISAGPYAGKYVARTDGKTTFLIP
jgi:hypothetical protein